ncbi:MAG: Archaellin [Candidatus Alkanophagales archaeon MCA70_species_2]|nr:Archaellin [Candidatus Alkanophaga liquidiphilum]
MRAKLKFKNKKGFTGLEAAIVLTAFVVVAAVFSYVVLNAGFFTTQKSKEVVHTGVTQATSSVELLGDVIAYGNTTSGKVVNITFTLALTAGHHPVDLTPGKTVISYYDADRYVNNATWTLTFVGDQETVDNILEFGEKAEISVNTSDYTLERNEQFTIEVKPPEGATLAITRTIPPSVDTVMNLH